MTVLDSEVGVQRRVLHPQFGRFNNLVDLSAKRANIYLSLLVPCQISFAGDSLNSLTGVSESMDMIE
jgi:hypothetical protein